MILICFSPTFPRCPSNWLCCQTKMQAYQQEAYLIVWEVISSSTQASLSWLSFLEKSVGHYRKDEKLVFIEGLQLNFSYPDLLIAIYTSITFFHDRLDWYVALWCLSFAFWVLKCYKPSGLSILFLFQFDWNCHELWLSLEGDAYQSSYNNLVEAVLLCWRFHCF